MFTDFAPDAEELASFKRTNVRPDDPEQYRWTCAGSHHGCL